MTVELLAFLHGSRSVDGLGEELAVEAKRKHELLEERHLLVDVETQYESLWRRVHADKVGEKPLHTESTAHDEETIGLLVCLCR